MKMESIDKFVLEEAKQLITTGFNVNDKCNKIINYKKNNYEFTIERSCFHPDNNSNNVYYEDYRVYFRGRIQDKIVTAGFYMEWYDNIINGELVPANTMWNPETGEFSHRNIKIRIKNRENDINSN